ncbi:MAG: hypothetical protein K0Q68_298 [Moraxellaceae bacterium]|nr:hypothetical protein [Moraxellaceae bacterium]
MKIEHPRLLVADVIQKLPLWVNWITYQPQGQVIACEDKPRLQEDDKGMAHWDVRGQHFIIGQATPLDDCWQLQGVTGPDCLDDNGFRHRPQVIRGLRIALAADRCALTVNPDGEVREWFVAPPILTAEGWQGVAGSRHDSLCWLAEPDSADWAQSLSLSGDESLQADM